jgi:putative transposase
VVRYKEGEERDEAGKKKPRSRSVFGFMALDGKDVVMVSDRSKAPDMLAFLELIRSENPDAQTIFIILDNARIHTAFAVKRRAGELNIWLIYLPPYSPDLNPIEFCWKDVKRELAGILDFDGMVRESRGVTMRLLEERKDSYSKHWREVFL